jgi:hypothetical protein
MRQNFTLSPEPDFCSSPIIIDYTLVPAGLCIRGEIWTGQETTFTAPCPKCGRTGVASDLQDDKQIIIHHGRIVGDRLEGVDYCEFLNSTYLPPHNDRHIEDYGGLMEVASNKVRNELSNSRTSKVVAIIDKKTQVDTACGALTSAGFTNDMIEVFCGLEGERDLDLKGESHGFLQHIKRKLQHFMPMQGLAIDRYERALLAGHCVIQVRTDSNNYELAHEILSSGGYFINFYGV